MHPLESSKAHQSYDTIQECNDSAALTPWDTAGHLTAGFLLGAF